MTHDSTPIEDESGEPHDRRPRRAVRAPATTPPGDVVASDPAPGGAGWSKLTRRSLVVDSLVTAALGATVFVIGFPLIAVIVLAGAALTPAYIFVHAHPALAPVADRTVLESVRYSGNLTVALIPGPRVRDELPV
jgi:hypothetical protein